ncbi:hypothetical protein E2C04_14625 [Nocardioides daphniae]|uniref:Peptidase S9 prolyl oligopeptidase catalytic domain-containing protein n=1 Tax=Nocardioides daphniae TaxID=402297 RepID=A0A4P7UFQ6_9ACTN|nr:hypothetical protein E2C04_14625 [Nocardioides daphniae]
MVQGYASAYDDVRLRDVVRPAAVPLVRRMASRCLSEPGVLASVLTALSMRDEDVLRRDAAAGPLGRRLEENEPDAPGRSPLWVAQGAADTLITPRLQRDYVAGVRAGGREVDLVVYPGLDHLSLVQEESPMLPDLLAWTEARLAD